jgi:quinolinate synthase
MKKITLEKVAKALENMETKVELDAQFMEQAHAPLKRMLELAQ